MELIYNNINIINKIIYNRNNNIDIGQNNINTNDLNKFISYVKLLINIRKEIKNNF